MTLCNLLRVPPIFIMDELFKNSFGLPEFTSIIFPENNDFVNSTIVQNEINESTEYYKATLLSFFKIILSCLSRFSILFETFLLVY
jgi:E3 ubiquitin-protein ligase RNF139